MESVKPKLLRVGELAKAVGKSVRAIHLYEELGLLRPVQRTSGGFRLFRSDAVDRINWITKLQAIGFSLTEIQGFVREFEAADSGRSATARVKSVFQEKLGQIRNSLAQLQVIENDLVEALEYLDSCKDCAPVFRPNECRACDHQGHERGVAPELFAGLSSGNADQAGDLVGLARVRASAAGYDDGDEDEGSEEAN
jgi:MerR family transcriptional regulator, copper efflux regulator